MLLAMLMAAAPPVSMTATVKADGLHVSLRNASKRPVSLWAFSLREDTKTPRLGHALDLRATAQRDGGASAEEVWNTPVLPPFDDLPGQPFVLEPGRTIDDVVPLGQRTRGRYRLVVRFDDSAVKTLFSGKYALGALPAVTLDVEL